jgi:hypothetical protein
MELKECLDSYQRVQPELDTLPLDELQVINLDVPKVVMRVLRVIPAIQALRAEFATLPGMNLERLDNLGDYARALAYAHACYRNAAAGSDRASKLAIELVAVRNTLQCDAVALAKRGILLEACVLSLRGGSGYKKIAGEGTERIQRSYGDAPARLHLAPARVWRGPPRHRVSAAGAWRRGTGRPVSLARSRRPSDQPATHERRTRARTLTGSRRRSVRWRSRCRS